MSLDLKQVGSRPSNLLDQHALIFYVDVWGGVKAFTGHGSILVPVAVDTDRATKRETCVVSDDCKTVIGGGIRGNPTN